MIKSRLVIIGSLLFVSATLMAADKTKCPSFLKVVTNNDARMEIPETREFFTRDKSLRIFEHVTRSGYENGHSFYSAPIRSGFALEGERAHIGLHRNMITELSINTASPTSTFPTKQAFIPEKAEAYFSLKVTLLPNFRETITSQQLGLQSESTLLSGKLSRSQIQAIMKKAADQVGETSLLQQLDRVSVYRFRSGQAELQIRLDGLAFAEFMVLLNALMTNLEDMNIGLPQ